MFPEKSHYDLAGTVKLNVSVISPLLQRIHSLDLIFIFLAGDLVVHEEKTNLRGGVDIFIDFSKWMETDAELDSFNWTGFDKTQVSCLRDSYPW